jgi:hypothetical protein
MVPVDGTPCCGGGVLHRLRNKYLQLVVALTPPWVSGREEASQAWRPGAYILVVIGLLAIFAGAILGFNDRPGEITYIRGNPVSADQAVFTFVVLGFMFVLMGGMIFWGTRVRPRNL